MPSTCIFQLDRNDLVYNSGEYISGRILFITSKMKRVNAVYVLLEGEAKVQWSISSKSESANYYGHQQYLHTRVNVFDGTEYGSGTHVYALMLRIPPDSPSSCKGPYGYVGYSISLVLDKPWSFDEIYRKPLTVVQKLNLNINPEYALPIKDENIKYLCNWPCRSGPISSTLVLPYTGFVSLQQIPFYLEVDNQSPHYDISSIEATIKQHFIFMARKPFKRNYFTRTIAKSSINEPTLRLTKRLYEGNVCVPEKTPRTTLNTNYIVYLHYTLQLKLKTGTFHYDTDISVPITIGTEPLLDPTVLIMTQPTVRSREVAATTSGDATGRRQVNAETQHEEQQSNNNTEDTRKTLQDDEPPSYDSCLPPSFSYATLSSQQNLDSSSNYQQERDRIYVTLPKFPGYNTFTTSTQVINMSRDSILDRRFHHSYGSLNTDHTGRSLDTFGSSGVILSETEEDVIEAEDNF